MRRGVRPLIVRRRRKLRRRLRQQRRRNSLVAEPVKTESARKPTEADIRAENLTPQVRRHTWINIAGPIAAVFLGIFAASMYLRPLDVLRFLHTTRLGWSSGPQTNASLKHAL